MIFYFLSHLDFLGILGSVLITGSWDCSGPQVCEIGDSKISRRPSVKISQSPHEARSAEWGDWAIFTRGLREIFPVSDFTDLRTSITTGYNHKKSMNKHEYFPKICNRPGDWSVLGSGTWGRQQNLLSGVSLINVTLPSSNEGSSVLLAARVPRTALISCLSFVRNSLF